MNRREEVFSVKGNSDYTIVLTRLQKELSQKLANRDITNIAKEELKKEIINIIQNNHLKCDYTSDINVLAERLYHDTSGWGFITLYDLLNQDGMEEININSWNDVDIIINGEMKKTSYSFLNPQQAIDIHKKMLNVSNTLLDESKPYALADLGANIRIAVLMSPLVDDNVGIASSIRIVKNQTATKDYLIENETLTEDMLEFLEQAALYGVSMVFAGETGAGKTYISGYILSQAAKKRRTYTIEESSREWDFVDIDKDGKIKNSIVHTKTYEKENSREEDKVDQNKLLEFSLRFDPSIIGVGEMRSKEAYTACEASNTGHTVISTTHSESPSDTPYRIMALAKKAYDFSDSTLLEMITKAFPIIVYCEKLADNSRKVTEIAEVLDYRNGEVKMQTLWRYKIKENVYSKNGIKTIGSYKREKKISSRLAQKMLKKGATKDCIKKFAEEE